MAHFKEQDRHMGKIKGGTHVRGNGGEQTWMTQQTATQQLLPTATVVWGRKGGGV